MLTIAKKTCLIGQIKLETSDSHVVSTFNCYAGGFPIESAILPLLKHTCVEVSGCHAGCQEVSRCYTRVEYQGMYIMYASASGNKAVHSGFEYQRRCHQKSKTEVSVAPQKGFMSSTNFFKKLET